jgi:hypothetical protein
MATQAKTSAAGKQSNELVCPECGKTFTRPQALGAHRRQAHGVAGTSKNAKNQKTVAAASGASSRRGGNRRTRATSTGASTATQTTRTRRAAGSSTGGSGGGRRQAVDRDVLLRALFPSGIPPQQGVIAAINNWLEEADRLARIR